MYDVCVHVEAKEQHAGIGSLLLLWRSPGLKVSLPSEPSRRPCCFYYFEAQSVDHLLTSCYETLDLLDHPLTPPFRLLPDMRLSLLCSSLSS